MTISTHRPLPIFSRPKILSPKSHQQRSLSAISSSSHQISLKIPTIISVPSSRSPRTKKKSLFCAAYVSAPASDPDSIEKSASADEARESSVGSSAKAVSWAVLWPLLARHKLRIAVSMVSLVGGTSCVLSMPIFSGKFFEVLIGRRTEPLWTLLSKIAVIYILEPIFTVVYVINMTTIWERVMASLRGQIFRRMLIQKVEFFDTYKVGELTGLLTSDLGSLKDVVSENISRDHGLRALSEVIGTICILFSLSTELAPVLGLLMLSISVLVAIFKRSTVPVFKSHGMVQASIADCATETFSAIRTVRSFGGEKRQISTFGKLVVAYQNSGIKLGILKSANESLTRVVIYISLLALYFLGGSKVKAGELAVGIMTAFIGYTFTLTFAVQGGVNTLADIRGTLAAVERINSTLSAIDIDESLAYGLGKELQTNGMQDDNTELLYTNSFSEQNQTLSERYMSALRSANDWCSLAWSGDICLEDVYFSYPLRSDVEVLNGLNLTLKCGKITALVGPSGAGKSTIVQLLARFYEPTRGRITVAGEDVRAFDKREWARLVSLVNQIGAA